MPGLSLHQVGFRAPTLDIMLGSMALTRRYPVAISLATGLYFLIRSGRLRLFMNWVFAL